MGGNKTRLIVVIGNINPQTYINDFLAVEALPFIQCHGLNVTFMHDNVRLHSVTIPRQFLATNNVNVLNWPANSPDLTLIEQMILHCLQHVMQMEFGPGINLFVSKEV